VELDVLEGLASPAERQLVVGGTVGVVEGGGGCPALGDPAQVVNGERLGEAALAAVELELLELEQLEDVGRLRYLTLDHRWALLLGETRTTNPAAERNHNPRWCARRTLWSDHTVAAVV